MSKIEFSGVVDGVLIERVNHIAILTLGHSRMCIVDCFISYEHKKGCGPIRIAKRELKKAYEWTCKKHGQLNA